MFQELPTRQVAGRVTAFAARTIRALFPARWGLCAAIVTGLVAADGDAKAAEDVAGKLQSELIKRLVKSEIAAEPFVPGANHLGAAILRVSITEIEQGSYWERFVIGFGLGRAKLQARIDLDRADTAGSRAMTTFNTSNASGRVMPGFILPAGIALATRNPIPLAVGGGLKLATSLRGLDGSVRGTAKAVVEQIKKYYGSVGWHWPADGRA